MGLTPIQHAILYPSIINLDLDKRAEIVYKLAAAGADIYTLPEQYQPEGVHTLLEWCREKGWQQVATALQSGLQAAALRQQQQDEADWLQQQQVLLQEQQEQQEQQAQSGQGGSQNVDHSAGSSFRGLVTHKNLAMLVVACCLATWAAVKLLQLLSGMMMAALNLIRQGFFLCSALQSQTSSFIAHIRPQQLADIAGSLGMAWGDRFLLLGGGRSEVAVAVAVLVVVVVLGYLQQLMAMRRGLRRLPASAQHLQSREGQQNQQQQEEQRQGRRRNGLSEASTISSNVPSGSGVRQNLSSSGHTSSSSRQLQGRIAAPLCAICLDAAATVGITHEKDDVIHCCLCSGCAAELQSKGQLKKCVYCRQPVKQLVQVVGA
jgi:hypothetical protein